MSNDEKVFQQLGTAINLIASQGQIAWTIFTVFLAGHAILAQAMFSAKAIGPQGDRQFAECLVTIVGVVTAFVWFFFQRHMWSRSRSLAGEIARFEGWRYSTRGLALSPFVQQGRAVSALMQIVPLATAALWLLGLIQVPREPDLFGNRFIVPVLKIAMSFNSSA